MEPRGVAQGTFYRRLGSLAGEPCWRESVAALLDFLCAPVFLLSGDLHVVTLNRAAADLHGLSRRDLDGLRLSDLWPPEQRVPLTRVLTGLRPFEPFDGTLTWMTKSGRRFRARTFACGLSPELWASILRPDLADTERAPPSCAVPLSPREAEILALLSLGRSTREMAAGLHLSVRTVDTHVAHILSKLGARNRLEVLAIAFRRGLVSLRSAAGQA